MVERIDANYFDRGLPNTAFFEAEPLPSKGIVQFMRRHIRLSHIHSKAKPAVTFRVTINKDNLNTHCR